jgi:hypothetical protein
MALLEAKNGPLGEESQSLLVAIETSAGKSRFSHKSLEQ